jgi:hypothetical protein
MALFGALACEISARTVEEQDEPFASAGSGSFVSGHGGSGTKPSAGSAGKSGSSSSVPVNGCESACVREVFNGPGVGSCSGCHTSVGPQGGLDLSSPNVTMRLKNVLAQHALTPAGACVTGDYLLDTRDWTQSWLLKKVTGTQVSCGSSMPPPPLPQADILCLQTYVRCVAGQ